MIRPTRRPPCPGTPGRGLKGEEGKKKGRGGEARGKGGRARVPFSAKSWGYSAFQYILPDLTPKTNRCASRFATTASALRASAAPAVRRGAAEMRRKRCFPHWLAGVSFDEDLAVMECRKIDGMAGARV